MVSAAQSSVRFCGCVPFPSLKGVTRREEGRVEGVPVSFHRSVRVDGWERVQGIQHIEVVHFTVSGLCVVALDCRLDEVPVPSSSSVVGLALLFRVGVREQTDMASPSTTTTGNSIVGGSYTPPQSWCPGGRHGHCLRVERRDNKQIRNSPPSCLLPGGGSPVAATAAGGLLRMSCWRRRWSIGTDGAGWISMEDLPSSTKPLGLWID
jgi:hypothetical protein